MKKQLVAAGIATAIGVTSITGIHVANAATTEKSDGPMSGLVDAIAAKFSLDKSEVQAVFDEQKAKMQAEREAAVKDEVAKLVTEGKLTQDQADAINAKRAELRTEREEGKEARSDQTREERKSEMKTKRAELQAWAEEQGIDDEYLRYVFGGKKSGEGGFRHSQ